MFWKKVTPKDPLMEEAKRLVADLLPDLSNAVHKYKGEGSPENTTAYQDAYIAIASRLAHKEFPPERMQDAMDTIVADIKKKPYRSNPAVALAGV